MNDYVIKTRQDNNIIDHTGSIYTENEIELSWSVEPSVIHEKKRWDSDVTDYIGAVYVKIKTELSGPIELGAICYEN